MGDAIDDGDDALDVIGRVAIRMSSDAGVFAQCLSALSASVHGGSRSRAVLAVRVLASVAEGVAPKSRALASICVEVLRDAREHDDDVVRQLVGRTLGKF